MEALGEAANTAAELEDVRRYRELCSKADSTAV